MHKGISVSEIVCTKWRVFLFMHYK